MNKWDVKEAKGICHEGTWGRRVPTEEAVREAARATLKVTVASALQAGKSSSDLKTQHSGVKESRQAVSSSFRLPGSVHDQKL